MSDKGTEYQYIGTAFPTAMEFGLTKRELFAAMAPPYPFALPRIDPMSDALPFQTLATPIAAWNVAYADALLAELAK